jgi:large subunit ribosomal protein L3
VKAILGKKIGMTHIFRPDGVQIPVTVIEAGPCKVIQVKREEHDGYDAVQVGFDAETSKERANKKYTKPIIGHFGKANTLPYRTLRELKMENLSTGDEIRAEIFKVGEKIDITAISKGKGFQGVMKRHHYKGGPGSHGSMFNRAPGSIGASAYPSRVWKNKGLPGQMGNVTVTTKNLEIIDIKPEQNIMLVKGATPGPKGGYLLIKQFNT